MDAYIGRPEFLLYSKVSPLKCEEIMAKLKEYYGKTLLEIDGGKIKEYFGKPLYEIDGFLSRRELMALLAILFAS